MTTEKQDALAAMLEQYKTKSESKFTNTNKKTYDIKNYFSTFIEKGVDSATKTIRIVPTIDGSSPFVEVYCHKSKVGKDWKTFACLKHEKDKPCPFCEAREELLSTGTEEMKDLAKKYNARLMYIVKVIDRDHEEDGVKFWRFNNDYTKKGVLDKIYGVISAIKKDITSSETGRDLVLTINRGAKNEIVISSIVSLDASPLSTDTTKLANWTSDMRTWEDVYSVKGYDFLSLIVRGETPVWDKKQNKFVAKSSDKPENNTESESDIDLASHKKAAKEAQVTIENDESDIDLPF